MENTRKWLPNLRDLDDDQKRVINTPLDGNMLIYGPAGGGKTAIAIFRAKLISDQARITSTEANFQVFVFTLVLRDFIRSASDDLGIDAGRVRSFYGWLHELYRAVIDPNDNAGHSREQWKVWASRLLLHFKRSPKSLPRIDYIIIDEAQDFDSDIARLINMLSPNVMSCGDIAQTLTSHTEGASFKDFENDWLPFDRQRQTVPLRKNYRTSKQIAALAAHFLDVNSGWTRDEFVNRTHGYGPETGRQTPVGLPIWHFSRSRAEIVATIGLLLRNNRGGLRIGILVRTWNEAMSLQKLLVETGSPDVRAISNMSTSPGQWSDGIPVITTIHSSKGLEFDTVVLPDLSDADWHVGDEKNLSLNRRMLFVAITRARIGLQLFALGPNMPPMFEGIPESLFQMPRSAPISGPSTSGGMPGKPEIDPDDLPF